MMAVVNLDGATGWLGGRPELAGRVVLVNFWTLTCINWIRQAPARTTARTSTRPGAACCARGGYIT